MKVQEKLLTDGQSLWMDNHSRQFIHDGSLIRYIEEFSVTGLSLGSESLRRATAESAVYDDVIEKRLGGGICGEPLACSLLLDDIRHAADLLRPVYDRTDGVGGWAMLPASPLAVDDPETLTKVILNLHDKVCRPNVLVRLPVTRERLKNIEELVCKGVPLNITNVYSDVQYHEVAEACLNGINRRIEEKLKPVVPVFITIGVFCLETALADLIGRRMAAAAAVAMAQKIYVSMRVLHGSPRWERAYNSGARPLRLVWNCSCGSSKEPDDKLALAAKLKAPFTVLTLPQQLITSLSSSMDHDVMPYDCSNCDRIFDQYRQEGFDVEAIAGKLQEEAVATLRNSWIMMLEAVAKKSARISQLKSTKKQGDKV